MADGELRENIFGDLVEDSGLARKAQQSMESSELNKQVYNLEETVSELEGKIGEVQSGSNTHTVNQATWLGLGDIISVSAGPTYYLARANNSIPAETIGIITQKTDTGFTYCTGGHIDVSGLRDEDGEELSPGTLYYLSRDKSGKLTSIKPTTEGDIVKPILLADGASSGVFLNYRGIEIEKLVKDEDDMASDSDTHMATQQSIKAYSDANLAEAKSYTDDELTDYASDTVTFTNKTIDADNNTISNLEHGAELDAPVAGTGVTHGHISDVSQTIAGEKTFSTFPVTPSAAPDADYEVANKKYVDDNIVDNTDITKEPTGFTAPEDVIINYDSTTRKITLTGTVNAYYRGEQVSALTSGWVSDAHADVAGVYFLIYDGSSFSWLDLSTTTSDFAYLLIAYVRYDATNSWALRECHGVMPWQTHKELHDTVGTYKDSGGTLGDYTLESSTAADRRPSISATVLYDEDLPTTNPALTAGSYTQYYLSSSDTANFATAEPDIVPLSGTQPYWNEYSGGTWGQTLLSNNDYMAVWVIAIPTTADTASQNYRFIFAQGQQQSANLEDIQALTPNDYTVGELSQLTPESVFIAKIIIKYQGGDWNLVEVNALTGTRLSQASSPTGSYLSSVSTTSPITGTGSATSPVDLDIATLTEKSTLADDDLFLIEDSEASNAPKKVKKSSLGSGSSNVEDGTADGQQIYWDNTAGEYKHTETSEFVWDDTNKRVGIGNASPAVDLEVSHNYDGASAIYVNNSTSGTNGSAIINVHGGGTTYAGILGYFSAGHGVSEWQNKAVLASGGNTSGLNIVDQSTGNSIDFQVGGYANGDIVCSMLTDKVQFREELELDMNSGNASITLVGVNDHYLYSDVSTDTITMENNSGSFFRAASSIAASIRANTFDLHYTAGLDSAIHVDSQDLILNDDNQDLDFTLKGTAGSIIYLDAGNDRLCITPTTLDFFGDADITSVSTGTSDNDKLVTQGYVDDEIAGISSGTDFLEVQVFT